MEDRIRKILEAAIQAPSGDNCQPWRFSVQERTIDLYNRPEKDQSLYNYRQRASLVAHGALLENLSLAAAAEGFQASVKLFPYESKPDHIARVELVEAPQPRDPLANVIFKRCTNRGRFADQRLDPSQIAALEACANDSNRVRVVVLSDVSVKGQMSSLVSKNDWLVFANRPLHKFLFEQLRWNQEEAMRTRDGLDIETLALNRLDRIGFANLRHWPLVVIMNFFGLAHMIGRKAEQLCRASSLMGAVVVSGSSQKDYVFGGQVMERVWLQATAMQLQFQPYAGIAFLLQQVRENVTGDLSLKSIKVLQDVQARMQPLLNLAEEDVAVMFFRVGPGLSPVGRSIRYELDDLLQEAGT